jgi:hypothetical protein
MMALISTSYVVEAFGEAKPSQDIHILLVVAGFTGNNQQKGVTLGGLRPRVPSG